MLDDLSVLRWQAHPQLTILSVDISNHYLVSRYKDLNKDKRSTQQILLFQCILPNHPQTEHYPNYQQSGTRKIFWSRWFHQRRP